ncbi:MAG: hypothetical protein GY822_32025 [Deltaproteobacteria bacterium]|nr:hypothetical protein [Deltaproteobacteria bacterium]
MFALESDIRKDAPAGLFLSRKGNWFHDGDQLHHSRMCSLLHRSIERDDDDLIVTTGRDRLSFVAEDAPYRIKLIEKRVVSSTPSDVLLGAQPSAAKECIVITCSDDESEILQRSHVWATTADGAIYLSVKSGRFWALLSSGAQQWLQPYLQEDDDGNGFHLSFPADWTSEPSTKSLTDDENTLFSLKKEGDEFNPAAHP